MIVAASAAKVVDYSTFEKTQAWFTHENLLLTAYEDQQKAKAWEARMLFRLSPGQTESAEEAVNQVISHLIPWAKVDDLGDDSDRINHMIADWWRFFAGDKLDEVLENYRRRRRQ